MSRTKRSNHAQSPMDIAAEVDFKCNSMSGHNAVDGYHAPGELLGEDLEQFMADRENIRYVVLSYFTPIAWKTADGTWYKVKAKFSPTTSKHQSRLYLVGA